MKLKYKELVFYIVETKEDFFLNVTSQLYSGFRNHRVLQIEESDDIDTIKFYGTKKRLTYTASLKAFNDVVVIKDVFKINPN